MVNGKILEWWGHLVKSSITKDVGERSGYAILVICAFVPIAPGCQEKTYFFVFRVLLDGFVVVLHMHKKDLTTLIYQGGVEQISRNH